MALKGAHHFAATDLFGVFNVQLNLKKTEGQMQCVEETVSPLHEKSLNLNM